MAKVLVVEDDPLIQRMYEQILTFDKHDISLAGNGLEGLKAAGEKIPDIILLDIMMPEYNGLQMLTDLKKIPELQNIPVIMLTNIDNSKDVQLALGLGAVAYVVKAERTPREVANLVKQHLGLK